MKGSVYIIRSHQTDDVYYGCTMQMLCQRMADHRACYKRWLNGIANYVSSYDILKYDDAYIELVEEVEFMNKAILYAREGHYIRENKCVNKQIAGRTRQQWTQDNKEDLTEYQKQYREDNKEIVAEYRKQYYEANKAEINERRRQKYEAKRAESN
jgi:adenylate kinase family enzyme